MSRGMPDPFLSLSVSIIHRPTGYTGLFYRAHNLDDAGEQAARGFELAQRYYNVPRDELYASVNKDGRLICYIGRGPDLCEMDAMCSRPAIGHAGNVPVCAVHAPELQPVTLLDWSDRA